MKKPILFIVLLIVATTVQSQTLYVPNGTAGIAGTSNGNVGIGTATPAGRLEISKNGSKIDFLKGDLTGQYAKAFMNIYGKTGGAISFENQLNDARSTIFTHNGDMSLVASKKLSFAVGGALPSKLTILENGNTGIGIATPTNKLHINAARKGLLVNGPMWGDNFTDAQAQFTFTDSDITESGIKFNKKNGGGNFDLMNAYYEGNNLFMIKSNGNVGVGISAPSEKLEVKSGLIRIDRANNQDNNSPGLTAVSNDDFNYDGEYINQYGFGFHGFQDGTSGYTDPLNTYMSGHFGIDFFTAARSRMRISRNGEVTIGTVNRQPGYLLAVNGAIKAKEIKVEANWADFVFDDDYDLKSLDEVENYIEANHHLPDIPSEAEVTENGISLGEMNAKLLQKIEELTLYLIKQNKELQETKAEIKDLRREVVKKVNKTDMLLD